MRGGERRRWEETRGGENGFDQKRGEVAEKRVCGAEKSGRPRDDLRAPRGTCRLAYVARSLLSHSNWYSLELPGL